MNCEQLQEALPGFLEDNLEESVWKESAQHLRQCAACRSLSIAKTSFASDLKKLNLLPLPETLLGFSKFSEEKPAAAPPAPHKPVNYAPYIKFGALAACFAFAGFIVFAAAPKVVGWITRTVANPQVLSEAEPAALRELKQIARRLGVSDFSGGGASAKKVPESIAKNVFLKPLHIHILFNDQPAKADFLQRFAGMYPDFSFRAPSFWVVSLNRPQLETVLRAVKQSKVAKLEETALMDPDLLPEFEGTIRVSFHFDVPSEQEPLALSQHWHFYFNLPNRYNLLEKLQNAPASLLYQAPEVWIFEVAGSRIKDFMKAVEEYPGVKADFGKKTSALPDTDEVTQQVFIYLKES